MFREDHPTTGLARRETARTTFMMVTGWVQMLAVVRGFREPEIQRG